MKIQKVLILSLDEAREALVQFYADVLVNDRDNTVDLLREGKIPQLPNLSAMSALEIANLYGELCLGEKLLENDQTLNLVMVQTADYTYEYVADEGQLNRGKANDYGEIPGVS